MGRAGGGGRSSGGRSGGGSFSRSGLGGSGSRSSGGGSRGGFSGGGYRPPRPIIVPPIYGRSHRTVIINNGNSSDHQTSSGNYNTTGEGRDASDFTNTQKPAAAKPLTPEQRIHRAEQLAKEAENSKKSAVKRILVSALLFLAGILLSFSGRGKEYEKPELIGTVDAGYLTDEGFFRGHNHTENALKEFYQKTGIPLYVYAIASYGADSSSCDSYAEKLYDTLFTDENHVLLVYYDNADWWSWVTGEKAKVYMPDDKINELIDKIYVYWYNESYNNDEVFAKGILKYAEDITSVGDGMFLFSGILWMIAAVLFLSAVYTMYTKGKEQKRYQEEAGTLRTELMLSKPLETFGNDEVEALKDKYK